MGSTSRGQRYASDWARIRALPPSSDALAARESRLQALKQICLSIVRLFPPYQILFTYFHSDKEDLEKAKERDGWADVWHAHFHNG